MVEPDDEVPLYYVEGFRVVEKDDETVLIELIEPKHSNKQPSFAPPIRMTRKAFDKLMVAAELQTPPETGLKGQLQ